METTAIRMIIGLDLGKYNSTACTFCRDDGEFRFQSMPRPSLGFRLKYGAASFVEKAGNRRRPSAVRSFAFRVPRLLVLLSLLGFLFFAELFESLFVFREDGRALVFQLRVGAVAAGFDF